ncbi:MAG: hypothetical protein ACLQFR_10455 [Streptosporangiaceae bacterium]
MSSVPVRCLRHIPSLTGDFAWVRPAGGSALLGVRSTVRASVRSASRGKRRCSGKSVTSYGEIRMLGAFFTRGAEIVMDLRRVSEGRSDMPVGLVL